MCSTVTASVCGQQCQRGKGKLWPISEIIQEIQRRSLSDLYTFQKYFQNRINTCIYIFYWNKIRLFIIYHLLGTQEYAY